MKLTLYYVYKTYGKEDLHCKINLLRGSISSDNTIIFM